MIVDLKKSQENEHGPVHINRTEEKGFCNIKFLGIHISNNLKQSICSHHVERTAKHCLYFQQKLRWFVMALDIVNFFLSLNI